MGKIGCGYGSEWHLLRYLGRHRQRLDRAIISEIGTLGRIEWLDFGFDQKKRKKKWYDAELEGLEFLAGPEYAAVRAAWKKFWPQSGTSQNWDAVGWFLANDGNRGLLLVEAKAHTGELESDCGAENTESVRRIKRALEDTKKHVKAKGDADWFKKYYQYANRLAVLHFLRMNCIPARLLFIYFTGDERDDGKECPADENGWKKAIEEQDKYLGLPNDHQLTPYIHKVYLSVTG